MYDAVNTKDDGWLKGVKQVYSLITMAVYQKVKTALALVSSLLLQ